MIPLAHRKCTCLQKASAGETSEKNRLGDDGLQA